MIQHDPDPLYVEPEPVRRQARPREDLGPLIILWACAIAIVVLTAAAVVANASAPRPAPTPGYQDSPQASGLGGAQRRNQPAFEASQAEPLGAPQPRRYSGTATWYCSTLATCTRGYRPSDLIGAIDRKDSSFRPGDRVTVRAFGRAVTVRIADVCACGGVRVIDLSRAAFSHLANPDLGVIPVVLELAVQVDNPITSVVPSAPATDIEP